MKLANVVILFVIFSLRVSAQDYSYSSIFYHEQVVLSIENKEATFIKEKSIFSLVACSKEELDCFDTHGMAFAIPKTKLDMGMTWDYKKHTYSVDEYVEDKLSAFGVGYFIIRSKISSGKVVAIFLFSETKGLLGMRLLEGPHGGTVWLLNSSKGFPR